MPDDSDITYIVIATDPAGTKRVTYKCVGSTMAHEKAAELRMGRYKDVAMSTPNVSDDEAAA
jgi:hypothetical protein